MTTMVDDTASRITRRLRLERDTWGWSQADLAERARLSLRAEGEARRLSRAADQPVWRDPDTGYLRKQVFSQPDHPLKNAQVEMPPGQRIVFPA